MKHFKIDDVTDNMAQMLADEIDWEIIKDLYRDIGWTEVKFYPIRQGNEAMAISQWCRDNLQGHVKSRGDCFMFERADEAMMFRLRWGA